MEIYVLNGNLEIIGMIENFNSLIWANRYYEIGDCEVYAEATATNLELLVKDNYLIRFDDDMICRIESIEIDTSSEKGNYIIAKGFDCKKILNQRVIWGQLSVDGNVEDYIRNMVTSTCVDPEIADRQIKKTNGTANFFLGTKANFTEVITEQISYVNVGNKIKELCKKYNWGYKVITLNTNFYFILYKGTDRSTTVIFSNEYENLNSTKYKEDSSNLGNVAITAGEGEGSNRSISAAGQAESLARYEIYVDANEISKTITWGNLIEMYPTTDEGGEGYITTEGSNYVYKMNTIDIQIIDTNQLIELQTEYPTGEIVTVEGIQYYRIPNVIIADLESATPESGDNAILRSLIYSVYLLTKGYEALAQYGIITSFEGTVDPVTTFKYKEDYFLGDLVTVQNEYKISIGARITEVVEVQDEKGYSIEPKFEYIN